MPRKRSDRVFRMKRFELRDNLSANKIGVDGVMIGSWTGIHASDRRVLDVGCGCGIISLMMAQRSEALSILGIDIEENAVAEASVNAFNSPWSDRIEIRRLGFSEVVDAFRTGIPPEKAMEKFDVIISNPPFFESGVDPSGSQRMLARHAGSLSPSVLIEYASGMLTQVGRLSLIVPAMDSGRYERLALGHGLRLDRICCVKGNPDASPKRAMMEFVMSDCLESLDMPEPKREWLTIESSPGVYTPEYIALGKDFYLKF